MDIQLTACDLDGTLLNKQGLLPDDVLAALAETAEKGVFVVPCTGRCWDELPEKLLTQPYLRFAVLSNGARIVDLKSEQTLYRTTIEHKVLEELLAVVIETGCSYQIVSEGSDFVDEVFMTDTMSNFQKAGSEYAKLLPKFRFVKDLPSEIRRRQMPVEKFTIRRLEPEQREIVQSFLEGRTELTSTDFVLDPSVYGDIEIGGENCDKGTGLSLLCEMLEIPMETVFAMGDGHNDISMLEAAGFGVAMGNAPAELKQVADYVTLSSDQGGAALALRKFV